MRTTGAGRPGRAAGPRAGAARGSGRLPRAGAGAKADRAVEARGRGRRGAARARRRTARGLAVTAAVLAAVMLVAGCGGGGGGKAGGDDGGPGSGGGPTAGHRAPAAVPTSHSAEPPASSAPGVGPDGTAETVAPSAGGGRAQATVPRARLTPATGTFTERQKDYLVGKVPEGMDPAAVLQNGQDACDRIANTAQEDARAARQAVKDGEIPGARDAITYLCPAYRYLLD